MKAVIAYDIGTTGCKTCLYRLGNGEMTLLAAETAGYPVSVLPNGGVEQNPEDWWNAMRATTKRVLGAANASRDDVGGISFCSQMQGVVLVGFDGRPLRPAMIYMDQRGTAEVESGLRYGLKIEGMNASLLLKSLVINGGVSASVKDPLWKYKWVEKNEPAVFEKTHKWLDVKEYLIARCTGEFVMTHDSAHSTFLADTRPGRIGWSSGLVKSFKVNPEHLPRIVAATDLIGGLSSDAATDLALREDTPVFGGGGDLAMIAIGAGCVNEGEAHVYMGTSGWVSTVTTKRKVDTTHMMASILGGRPGLYNYIGEHETAGKCLEWVRDHLALDSIGVYFEKKEITDKTLLEYLDEVVGVTPPRNGDVLFAPWLHGNRSPFEDPDARGCFIGVGINTGKQNLIRAVVEGIVMQAAWVLELQERVFGAGDSLRFVGGVAQSKSACGILADVTGKRIEVPLFPQNAGAFGAATVCATGLGEIDGIGTARNAVKLAGTYHPDPKNSELYRKKAASFRKIYTANKDIFKLLAH